ncbi:VIR protein [Plasmodium vivax]|uniref:VIR protein n=1 Tax=Plasmodium vivax TaxID=5855 RepID=A0A1G4E8W6_PLAVI|nr:VIR protein [Plasmodium vivax]
MSLDDYEKHCPLNLFIAQIENLKGNRQIFSTSEDLTDIVAEKNEELTNIGCSVYRGYTYLTARDEENRRYFCDYLNLWLDEQKSIYVTNNSNITNEQWNLIEKLWNRLKQDDDPSRHCDRQGQQNSSEIRKRIDLMVYCVNRDYFKSYCERAIQSSNNIDKRCSNFSSFTDKYYEKFYKENECFDEAHDPQDYRYFISNECTLYNMQKTFPKFNSQYKKILYENSRTAINICGNNAESGGVSSEDYSATTEDDDDPTKLDDDQSVLAVGQDGLSVRQDGLSISYVGSESGPINAEESDIPSIAVLTSPDYKYSKPIYYAGLSVSGVFFTSMVLYKV